MDKKVIWILVIIVVLFLVIAGAGFGTAYYLTQRAKNTPTPSPSASICTSCQKASTSPVSDSEQIKADHCLKQANGGTGNITIADIAHYSEVTSPITFSGTANVFEGSFQVKIVDCEGNKIINQANAQTKAGDVGVSNPYTVTISYSASYAGHYAYIEAYDLSAKDGSVQDTIQVPVLLK
ncbi:MAG: Gmad2 immunoglobulin-like domain-containing protein [Candidatus Berkelbacteria bacterium]|nr:Gmad2 immunoglobulin-like domain-containing protein [Candidatus Berkelbacteria bacterium]